MNRTYEVHYYHVNDKYTLCIETAIASNKLDAKDVVLSRNTSGFIVITKIERKA
jgi:hypothetical protein